jgi:hypothetical protein
MSRSGYDGDVWGLELGRYRGQVASAIRGKRGQAFIRELIAALDALPEKRLIARELHSGGEVCAIGSIGLRRGLDMSRLDPENYEEVAREFGVASQLVCEIEYMNDDAYWDLTPERRWQRVRQWAVDNLKPPTTEQVPA